MSVLSDLSSAFAERDVTVPVICGSSSTRAFFDRAGSIRRIGGGPVQVESDTLYVELNALTPDLVQETQVQVGEVGDETAVSGKLFRVTNIQLLDDGLMQAIAIAGGAQ